MDSDIIWKKSRIERKGNPDYTITPTKGSLYAILFNAYSGRFSRDLSLAKDLLDKNNVKQDNIYIAHDRGYSLEDIYPATFNGLKEIVSELHERITSNDRLFVFVTNHGHRKNDKNYIRLCSSYFFGKKMISTDEFSDMFSVLNPNVSVFYFSQCYSGGFAQQMGFDKNICISNTSQTKRAYGWKNDNIKGTTIGTLYSHFFLENLLTPNTSIYDAFKKTNATTKQDLNRKFSDVKIIESFEDYPHLYWENVDPKRLCLIENK